MSQSWTDDVYGSGHTGGTDLQNIENNFAAIKSMWSGSSAPANAVAGMWWHDTGNNLIKCYYGGSWVTVYDLANERAVDALDSVNCSRNVIAGTGLSGGGVLSADRTITHAAHTGDVTGSGALTIGSAKVTQSMLKTSTSAVSTPTGGSGNYTPAGGSYCFYPQVKRTSGTFVYSASIASGASNTAYATYIYLSNSSSPNVCSAQFRYVTSSGEVYWAWFLIDKKTGDIVLSGAAPDHPCFGNSGKPNLLPHPFPDYDPKLHEIAVVNPSAAQLKQMRRSRYADNDNLPDRDLLQVINEDYELDHKEQPWPDVPVTVGLRHDEADDPDPVEVVKKVILQPDYIKCLSLRLKK